jgi:predicted nucleotide-binding protein
MDELLKLLNEWDTRVRGRLVSEDEHAEWIITIEHALKSLGSGILSTFRHRTAFFGWQTIEGEEYQKCIVSDIQQIHAMIKANERFPSKDADKERKPIVRSSNSSVFIIHGHHDAVRESVARFIEKLGLAPIVLFERPNAGKTIIEKFERESEVVGFAIALLTADDVAICNRDKKEEVRSRQNVVFELGYFVAKLGRGRVAVLKESGVAEPSDLHGIVYTEIDSRGAWKLELAKELKAAGFAIDMNKVV